jgi:hypothetical protein
MTMKIVTIALAEDDFLALREIAHRDRRDPRQQARVILERAIARRRMDQAMAADVAVAMAREPEPVR